MRDDFKSMVLTLTLVMVVVAALLSFVYVQTRPRIEAHRQEKIQKSLGVVFPNAPGETLDFTESEELMGHENHKIYEACNGEEVVGWAVETTVAGYGGEILMLVGVDPGGVVTGVRIVSHRETRGFERDGRMAQGYLDRFAGKKYPLAPPDAVSGATVSCKAVNKGVEDVLYWIREREREP